jgi:hypothetical protein
MSYNISLSISGKEIPNSVQELHNAFMNAKVIRDNSEYRFFIQDKLGIKMGISDLNILKIKKDFFGIEKVTILAEKGEIKVNYIVRNLNIRIF